MIAANNLSMFSIIQRLLQTAHSVELGIILMNNYNCPSYYRSNPYTATNYLPPAAYKNRKLQHLEGEIPQGEEFFAPTAKKHYGSAYLSRIEEQNIMKNGEFRPIQAQAMKRSYFRSLNNQDIEGSTTNTLISKAVSNKIKAQHELARKRQNEKIANDAKREVREQDQRTPRQLMRLYHSPNQYHHGYSNQLKDRNLPDSNYHTSQQIVRTARDNQKGKVQNYHLSQKASKSIQVQERNDQPIKGREVGVKERQNSHNYQPNPHFDHSSFQSNHEPEQIQSSTPMHVYRDLPQPHNSVESQPVSSKGIPLQRAQYLRQSDRYFPNKQMNHMQSVKPTNPNSEIHWSPQSSSLKYQPHKNQSFAMKSRDQLRQHNPTNLSYVSQAFNIASRNIMNNAY